MPLHERSHFIPICNSYGVHLERESTDCSAVDVWTLRMEQLCTLLCRMGVVMGFFLFCAASWRSAPSGPALPVMRRSLRHASAQS